MSLDVIICRNISFVGCILIVAVTELNKILRSLFIALQWRRRCISSSISFNSHLVHIRWFIGVIGLLYRLGPPPLLGYNMLSEKTERSPSGHNTLNKYLFTDIGPTPKQHRLTLLILLECYSENMFTNELNGLYCTSYDGVIMMTVAVV